MTEAVEAGGMGLTKTEASLPYMLAIAVFAVMMVPAGRLQDRMGPRVAAMAGALLTGSGLVVSSFAGPGNLMPVLIGFGLMAGSGFGLGYAAATPAAIKWFPAEKKGMITGIVVSGFGLAPVYIAPLSKHLLGAYGVGGAFRILGVAFTLITLLLARMIVNPPVPVAVAGAAPAPQAPSSVWREMVASRSFYLLYLEYTFAALAGLMIIGHLAKIIAVQSGGLVQTGFLFVASMAVFNALGRLMAGILSDKFGRIRTLAVVLLSQACVMLVFPGLNGMAGFFVGSAVVGFSYGACLALFPATVADFWGAKNFGLNYGILFTAWGLGGMFGPFLAGRIADLTGSYQLAYYIAAGFLVTAAALTSITRRPAPAASVGEQAAAQAG
ncbi:MAG: OFA family MFS transporter [Proteobacteria bacterium]|nr:OFA family MFS transporter [Pseudomonadota bacterium]MBU1596563.1 OFA family MFS transporter [Pseudomonadota bacterium]